MPPLQQPPAFDAAAIIPFGDQPATSDAAKLFESDLFANTPAASVAHHPSPDTVNSNPALFFDLPPPPPSEADISALFGLAPAASTCSPPAPAPAAAPVATRAQPQLQHQAQTYTPARTPTPLYSAPVPMPSIAAPAHYSSFHTSQERSPIAPFPSAPDVFLEPQQEYTTPSSSLPHSAAQTYVQPTVGAALDPVQTEYQPKMVATHSKYPSYTSTPAVSTMSSMPGPESSYPLHQYSSQYQQEQPQQQQASSYSSYSPAQYNVNGYSVYNTDYSNQYPSTQQNDSAPSDPMMLNGSSRSIFSRFGGSGAASSLGGAVGSGAPKLAKVAASYVSSTLAVTSTFASEKLGTASTKIADLWQRNQTLLPQQNQQFQQQQQQQQQQPYHQSQSGQHNNGVSTPINSGDHFGVSSYYGSSGETLSDTRDPTSYDGGATVLSNNANNNNNNNHYYQSSTHINSNNSSISNIGGTGHAIPFAATASSTLSNAASVAGSYLPSLSKLPALPALPNLPALRALPALPSLPWGNKDKNLQLPQQQSREAYSQQQQQQQQQQEQYSANGFYGSYEEPQEYSQQQQQHQQQTSYQEQPSYGQQQQQQHQYSYGDAGGGGGGLLLGSTGGNWWGGIKDEVQRGRRMVQTGVQVGVAWWWDSDTKNPLRDVV